MDRFFSLSEPASVTLVLVAGLAAFVGGEGNGWTTITRSPVRGSLVQAKNKYWADQVEVQHRAPPRSSPGRRASIRRR